MSQKNWVLPNWAFRDSASSWEEIQLLESPCPCVGSLVQDEICRIIDTCMHEDEEVDEEVEQEEDEEEVDKEVDEEVDKEDNILMSITRRC